MSIEATLFAWFSPAFPTGAFSFSHGLEAAAAEGRIRDERTLGDWLEGILAWGSGWNDAVLFNAASRAEAAALHEIAELACALSTSRERLAETVAQGDGFTAAVAAGWPVLASPIAGAPYPVAAGAGVGRLNADPAMALAAYLNGFCGNLVAVGIRLGLCGQTGGVRILAALGPLIAGTASRAAASTLEDLGGCAFASDIAGMRHETLTTRLFAS